jgi:acetyl esterase/lipase
MTIIFILLFVLIVSCAPAQNPVKLWGENPDDYRQKKVALYHLPSDSQSVKKTAVIFCPGGSYCYLAKENEGFNPARKFNSYGFDSFVLLYRRGIKGNRYPSQMQDLGKAIEYIRENYNFEKIGVCGFSAGGHLSGVSAVYLKTDFNIMIYPVVTMQDGIVHKKSRRNLLGQYYTEAQKDSMSLEMNVKKTLPPVFLIACKDDPVVRYENSVLLADSLKANGQNFVFKLYESGGHGFGISPKLIKGADKSAALWYKDFMKWFESGFSSSF